MKNITTVKLNYAAKKIAHLIEISRSNIPTFIVYKTTPYMNVRQCILDNIDILDKYFGNFVNIKNIVKTTRQMNYLTNEVLHWLRIHRFFPAKSLKNNKQHKIEQMEFDF